MPRGRKRGHHRGGSKNFTNMEDLAVEEEKKKKEKQWRRQRGLPSDDESGEGSADEDKGARAAAPAGAAAAAQVAPGDLPPSDDSDYDSSEDEREQKPKGVSHLIEVENPNYVKPKMQKVSALGDTEGGSSKSNLSRKQREEIEKQQAKERYMKMHLEGKTDEAQSDMARLALIRKQRDDAARKRDEEKKAKDDVNKAAEQRLLERKKQAKK